MLFYKSKIKNKCIRRKIHRVNNGFTLFEMLLVIFVIGLTLSIVIPSFRGITQNDDLGQMNHLFNLATVLAMRHEFGVDLKFTKESIFIGNKPYPYPEAVKFEEKTRSIVHVDRTGFYYPTIVKLKKNGKKMRCQFNLTEANLVIIKEN